MCDKIKLTDKQIEILKILNVVDSQFGIEFDKEFGAGEVRQLFYKDDKEKGKSFKANSGISRMLGLLRDKGLISYFINDNDSERYNINSLGKAFLIERGL